MSLSQQAWHAASTTPAFGVALTLVCYQFGCWLQKRCSGNPICNPVLIAIAAIVALLALSGTGYQTYFKSAAWIHFLLGPATVSLAIPLYKNRGEIRRAAVPIGMAVSAGAFTASASAMAIAWVLGASHEVVRSLRRCDLGSHRGFRKEPLSLPRATEAVGCLGDDVWARYAFPVPGDRRFLVSPIIRQRARMSASYRPD